MQAQEKTVAVVGEYYLRGVMEMASGFKLKADSTFEFFFSYGALDREGTGTWTQQGDKLIFNSPIVKGNNLKLVSETSDASDKIHIRIKGSNPVILSSIYCVLISGADEIEGRSNQRGEIMLKRQPIDSLLLISTFCPERVSTYTFKNKANNIFEFEFEPWMFEVFFNNLVLTLDSSGLSGQHPLLKEGTYHFERR